MPFGYLNNVAYVTLCTLLCLGPPRRPRVLAQLSFFLVVALNELPFAGLCWLLLWTSVAFAQGDIASAGAWAAVGLAVLTMAGLAVVAGRGLGARSVIARALADALGPGVGLRARSRLTLARSLLWPWPIRPRDVERAANLRYGPVGRRNLLDVYRHRAHPPDAPVLIHLHGGGYRHGRKSRQSLPLLHRFAGEGWVCVSANYRLRPAAQHPDHLVDLKRVIAWVREHGHEHGADPAVLVVAGSSAGAHLAALAALTPNDPAFQPGFEEADTSVTAAVLLGAYYGQGTASSPLAHVSAEAPPFLIAHGDRDTLVPVAEARRFASALRRSSANAVVYAELPGGQHAFDLFHSARFAAVVDGIESFAAWAGQTSSSRPSSPHRV